MWWCTPVIPALGRQREQDHKFEATYNEILSQKQKTKKLGNIQKMGVRMVLNFLIATLEARRQWNNLFSMMRENGFY
jgi:hypothetical protein